MAWGQTSWNNAIQDWFDEVKDFVFGVGKRKKESCESQQAYDALAVGQYTQVSKI